MESQINMESDFQLLPENTSIRDTDPGETSSGPDHVDLQQPAKKATRQWAAWTRQEEESFFTALRQVGKNFEKITCRVQSKNKDQVRHYYYRLVRRMNKLLGPGLCLDAKNTKDTNAAMLRWWSLLEKYSCKASKLHLKPRRFKIFVGALENQLLRDRKKNVRKRSVQGQNGPSTAPNSLSNHDKASGNDTRAVKLVLVDSQNVQKLGAGKGSLKRNVKMGVIRGNNKGESTATKPSRQRRKQGAASSAYKKWEKAAIAGVSLVADAAEHLERTATDKEIEYHQEQMNLPSSAQHQYVDSNAQANMKLKLQLFPIDDATRRALEMDKHNPYLELTLSTRKKISSVLEHLNRKWGSSRVASGELMLFPYGIHTDNLVAYQRWTQDSAISAADVYALIGSPSVFRLRYGWFLSSELKSPAPSASPGIPSGDKVGVEIGKEKSVDTLFISRPSTNDQSRRLAVEDQLTTKDQNHASAMTSTSVPVEMSHHIVAVRPSYPVESYGPAANTSCQRKETNTKPLGDVDAMRLSSGNELSAGEWADSLTNISVGDLLSEVPHDGDSDCIQLRAAESGHCLQQIPFSCDSFDAAIAAHLLKQQNKVENLPAVHSHSSSIWDAEETCDAFSFQKTHIFHQEVPTSCSIVSAVGGKHTGTESSPEPFTFVEELSDAKRPVDDPADGYPMDECPSDPQIMDNSAKDFTGLTDLYWPDSLGPLDLDFPPSKYHSEGLILSDSLSGLNRLIASSLDAFQSCSFMGMDKKDLTSAVEARETPSFSDYKIGSRV